MKNILAILLSLIVGSSFGQPSNKKVFNPVETVVINHRITVRYLLFNGVISSLDSNTFKYDNNILFVINTDLKYMTIFKNGILYPDIFNYTEFSNTKNKSPNEIMDSSVIVFKANSSWTSLFSSDSLRISDFREINFSKEIPSTKTFEFLLWRNHLLNPTEYTIKLKNDSVKAETDFNTFLKGARLIYISKGSILI